MHNQEYDLTYNDLNPTFLFTCNLDRSTGIDNYHCHEFIELMVATKGHGQFIIDNQEYSFQAGDVIILNPGTYHKSLPVTTPGTNECYIAFSDIHIRNTVPNFFPLPDNQKILSLRPGSRQEVFRICDAISGEAAKVSPGRYFMLKSYVIQLILLILREQELISHAPDEGCIFAYPNKQHVVTQMVDYFKEHYQEKISLDQIARNMYLSTFYISKIFKSETGASPINYLISLRMEKARDLLTQNPGLSIQEVASSVGYEDAYHFSKLFKKHYGVSPSKYRGA